MNTNSFLSLFITSIIATVIALFILGLVRAFVSKSSYIISILETVSLGAIASLLAYLVGYIFTL
ncbi:MAG: hypothetical protein CL899_01330 [Dehalococcoidia bacterium]|nr:hypothetical protein [Dehalococcoidia bacterium]